jgi:hypothetical protein
MDSILPAHGIIRPRNHRPWTRNRVEQDALRLICGFRTMPTVALAVMFDGPRIDFSFGPMRKQEVILPGNGGDNSLSLSRACIILSGHRLCVVL